MGSGKVALGSDLQRRKWVQDKLLNETSKSFWLPYTGRNSDSIIYQENNENASTGHTVVFDYSAKLTGKAIKGDDVVYGVGEVKRKFSDKITVDEFNLVVDNGKKFDGVDIGDLSINEHSDSMGKLADLFIRWKDQMLFDTLQGGTGQMPTHIYSLGTGFTYNDLIGLETSAKTGKNLYSPSANGAVSATKAARRSPLKPFMSEGGSNFYLCVIDSAMANALKSDSSYQTIIINADVRGNNNRAIEMIVGKLGKVVYVEASDFFGVTATGATSTGVFGLHDSEIDYSGLRKYIELADDTVVWEGTPEYDAGYALWEAETANVFLYSRGLLLGAGAGQVAFGKMPDYEIEWGDFKKTSQSLMEFWCEAKKTKLTLEGGKDFSAKIADIDFAVIAVDYKHTV